MAENRCGLEWDAGHHVVDLWLLLDEILRAWSRIGEETISLQDPFGSDVEEVLIYRDCSSGVRLVGSCR